jgi:integrase/recombinase XerD
MIGKITVSGPLGCCAEEFRDELRVLGYTSGSAELQMGLVGRLSRWLASEGLAVSVVDEQVVCHFLAVTEWDRQHVPTLRTFVPLLGWLRKQGLVAGASLPVLSPLDELLGRYRGWLERARGLSERTIGRYVVTSRRFLAERAGVSGGPTGVEGLTGGDVTRFLLGERSRGLSVGSMKGRAAELCSLLRFLYSDGMLEADLSASVPSVAGWRDSEIAPTLSSALVQALLDSCDRSSLTGSRDFAILVMLARLGLRAGEVAGLRLDDIDWRAGEITIRSGKARRQDRLPLPSDVGEALAVYLTNSRGQGPATTCRSVFVTRHAPIRPVHANTVSRVVLVACRRAGVPEVRAHRLRHALGAELARQGADLAAIGQVLRHRDVATTGRYAKVAFESLRAVAQPWPGADR